MLVHPPSWYDAGQYRASAVTVVWLSVETWTEVTEGTHDGGGRIHCINMELIVHVDLEGVPLQMSRLVPYGNAPQGWGRTLYPLMSGPGWVPFASTLCREYPSGEMALLTMFKVVLDSPPCPQCAETMKAELRTAKPKPKKAGKRSIAGR